MRLLIKSLAKAKEDFDAAGSCCSCFNSAPCSHCEHPGNFDEEDLDDSCFIEVRPVVILGHAQHGKDFVAELIAEQLGCDYTSASLEAAPYVEAAMGNLGYTYADSHECFEDRVNHREFWGAAIAELLNKDKLKLAKPVFDAGPIYCGVRRQDELDAIIAEYDPVLIWVDAHKREPYEDSSSMKLEYWKDMFWIDNNAKTLESLSPQLKNVVNYMVQN
jgi:hypothetical protein